MKEYGDELFIFAMALQASEDREEEEDEQDESEISVPFELKPPPSATAEQKDQMKIYLEGYYGAMNGAWPNLIVAMTQVKQELMELDAGDASLYFLPEAAAEEVDLIMAEINLGCLIDQHHADFMRAANGWKGFYQSIDLFGTDDLACPQIMQNAFSRLNAVPSHVIEPTGFLREDLLPLAASGTSSDLCVITKQTASRPGKVIWITGEKARLFPNFEEYFRAMTDNYRLMLLELSNEQKSSPAEQ
ncbi:MAG: SMI1/KNR4 family protein [Clostridiales bacterium]|nr:SMI1/KNR4 family protein [Clostridiales bacterium]